MQRFIEKDQKIELHPIALFCFALATAALFAFYHVITADPRNEVQIMASPSQALEKVEITPDMLKAGTAALSKHAIEFCGVPPNPEVARYVFQNMLAVRNTR
jgi:hypothetical protein